MPRKSKARRKRAKEVRAQRRDSVEAFDVGGITLIRDGNNIYASDSRSADDRQEFMAVVREQMLPRLRDERQQLRDRLSEILERADPIDLLARAGFLYLPINPDTYKESESDRGTAHIEYLALQVLPNSADEPRVEDPTDAASLAGEAIHVVRELFAVTAQLLLTFGQAEYPMNLDDPACRYQARTRLESMSVRGGGYTEHLRAILLGTVGQFDVDCQRLLGFTAQQALDMTTAIVSVVRDRLRPREQAALTRGR